MICIYHNRDLDGYTSGAIVKRKYPDAKLIGYDYGQSVPELFEKIPKGEPVIMIDVSLKMPDMLLLAMHTNWKLTWIDHHISAINDFKEHVGDGENFLTPVLENGISACEGGWKYLFPNERMPMAVTLLGEYDTWRNQDKQRWEDYILPFQFGMRIKCNSPESFPKELLAQSDGDGMDENGFEYDREKNAFAMCNEIISNGKCVLEYQKTLNETQCKKAAFEFAFQGRVAICLNGGGFNSDVFKSVYDERKHDLMIPFQFDGKKWTISLYTTKDDIDCSEIAKSFGGGGHKKAAGFQVGKIGNIFPMIGDAWMEETTTPTDRENLK